MILHGVICRPINDVACKHTKDKHILVNVSLKLLSPEAFSAQNALNIVWRPGSARTRWGAYSAPPEPVAGFKGPTSKGREEEGSGGEGRSGEGKENTLHCLLGGWTPLGLSLIHI